MSVPREYFTSAQYLELKQDVTGTDAVDNKDPNEAYFHEDYAQLVGRCCFLRDGEQDNGGTVLDWGAGGGLWMRALEAVGFVCHGVEWVEHEGHHPNIYSPIDISKPIEQQFETGVLDYRCRRLVCEEFDFALCQSVLMYMDYKDAMQALRNVFASFRMAAFIFTAGPDVALQYDKAGVFFPTPRILQTMCREIGGEAVVLNLLPQPEIQAGPAVLWMKNVEPFSSPVSYALAVRENFLREFHMDGYHDDFSVTI